MKRMMYTGFCLLAGTLWLILATVELAEARAGGGRGGGFRGSRSTAAPRQTFSPPPSTTTRPQSTPAPAASPGAQARPTQAQQPATGSFGRGLAGGLAGGLLGGMLGNMLFGGAGHAAGGAAGGGCSSIGLMDILIIGAIIYFGMKLLRRRRSENTYAYQGSGAGPTAVPPSWQDGAEPARLENAVAAELSQIRSYDGQFDEAAFKEMAQDVFFKMQAAWMRQDLSPVRELLTEEMYGILGKELEEMKAKGQANRLENIAIREIDFSEAWQEQGMDFITVGYRANLLDYVVDSATGQVVSGSDQEPVKFEEYWTFVRPIGPGPWKLSAIQQAETVH